MGSVSMYDINKKFEDGLELTVSGYNMPYVPCAIAQCWQSDSISRQDCNTGSWLAIEFNEEVVIDDIYTHTGTQIGVKLPGWYKVSYCVSHENQSSDGRKNVRTVMRKNGDTYILCGRAWSYSRNTTDEFASNVGTALVKLEANEYIEVMAKQDGTSGSSYTVQWGGETYLIVEFVRYET